MRCIESSIRFGLILAACLAMRPQSHAGDKSESPALSDVARRDECLRLIAESTAVLNTNPTLSLLLAIEANKQHPHWLVNEALINALARLREARTLGKHNRRAASVAFSADSRLLVTTGRDGTARIWDVEGGKQVRVLGPEHRNVSLGSFSPDGTKVLAVVGDESVSVWDVGSGKLQLTVRRDDDIERAEFDPTGSRILVATEDDTAVFNLADGKSVTLTDDEESKMHVRFNPDGTRVARWSESRLEVWDVRSAPPKRLAATDVADDIITVSFSPDSRRMAVFNFDTADVFDTATGAKLAMRDRRYSDGLFDATGRRILSFYYDGQEKAYIWDAETGATVVTLEGHSGDMASVDLSPSGHLALSTADDRTARLWDTRTGRQIVTLTGNGHDIGCARFSPDGRWVATGSDDGTIRLWYPETPGERATLEHSSAVLDAAFNADGSRIVTSCANGDGHLWMAKTQERYATLKGHHDSIRDATFSPDSRRVATRSTDEHVRLWDGTTGALVHTIHAHKWTFNSVRFSRDSHELLAVEYGKARTYEAETGAYGRRIQGDEPWVRYGEYSLDGKLVLTRTDSEVFVWERKTWLDLFSIRPETKRIQGARFSPDSLKIVTLSWGEADLWEARTGKHVVTLKPGGNPKRGRRPELHFIAFAPDSTRVAAVVNRRTVQVWDLPGGERTLTLRAHVDTLSAVEFSPDGRRLLSASRDGTARVWDAKTGGTRVVLRHAGPIHSATFSPDGRLILTASADGTARLWATDPVADAMRRKPRELTASEKRLFRIR